MSEFWTKAERDRWSTIRCRLDLLAGIDIAALRSLCARSPYHLSRKDRADIDRMIAALAKVRDEALPCPDEAQQDRRAA